MQYPPQPPYQPPQQPWQPPQQWQPQSHTDQPPFTQPWSQYPPPIQQPYGQPVPYGYLPQPAPYPPPQWQQQYYPPPYPYPYLPQMMPQVAVQTNVNIMQPQQRQQLSFLVRTIYFLCIGWWLGMFWALIAIGLCLTIIGAPIGLLMLNSLPTVLTLYQK